MSDITVIDNSESNISDEEQLVTMMVDDQLFGIPILIVQDIVEPDQITPVPLAPAAIAGILNLRGRIVTVIDLRECLGAKPLPEGSTKQMSVTVEYKGDLYTILVDSIGDVRSLPCKSFGKAPATLDENLTRICSGIFRLEGNLLVVLDVERILDEENILKTPKRTRRRRKINSAANKNTPQNTAKPKVKKNNIVSNEDETTDNVSQEENDYPKDKINLEEESGQKEDIETTSLKTSIDKDAKIMNAIEAFAGIVDTDSILSDLFKDISDIKMLDLLENLFTAVFDNNIVNIEKHYLALVKQPHLGDDHFISAATAMHAVLTKLDVSNVDSDRTMQIIDNARITLIDN